ncbi:hypothetical protein J6590_075991 [Homalodisca vitripennis]|nr:hypothetical protein J6590_075991 [Homalodisca vitripennis]
MTWLGSDTPCFVLNELWFAISSVLTTPPTTCSKYQCDINCIINVDHPQIRCYYSTVTSLSLDSEQAGACIMLIL